MSIEAMKQALEALEAAPTSWRAPEAQAALRQAIEQAEKQEPVGYLYSWVHSSATGRPDETYTSFAETIEQATRHEANFDIRVIYTTPPAAPVQEPEYKGWYCAHCQRGVDASEVTYHEQHTVCGRVITDDTPPAAPVQEPVAYMVKAFDAVQKIVVRADVADEIECELERGFGSEANVRTLPLYTTPQPQRRWVGTVDCIGLALDLEAQAKRVESQTVERAMLAAANGLRIIDKESKT